MKQLFLTSFLMSLVILPLLIHRKFRGSKFSSKVYYIIWIIIAIRLVLPFDISMENYIYNFSSPMEEYEISNYKLHDEQVEVKLPSKDNFQHEDSGTNLKDTKKLNFIGIIRDNLFNIWLAGAILYFVYNSFFYLLFKYRVKKSLSFVSEDIEEKFNDIKACMVSESKVIIRESHIIDSPMIIGIAKPILLVPKNINIKNIDYIFAHELVHLKRKDLVYKLIVFLATSIHWFNPVIHLMGRIANEDIELSCDEEVTMNMVREDKIEYSKTLIETISNRKKAPILTTSYSGGKEMIKRRLDKILDNIRKKSGKPLVVSLILAILCTSFLIGCETKKEKTLADELYSYKTKYVGDNSKVGGIVSKLEFPKEYSYKSMEILSKEEPYGLKLYFNGNANEAIINDFKIDSAILFSLIDNLDHIIYIVEEDGEEIEIGTITRANIDSITISILGMRTSELGNSKGKFNKLVEFYEAYNRENILNLGDVYTEHYHFKENHNGNIYLIRRIEPAAGEEWTDELWKYDKNNEGKKLYACQGLDFRVSSNEKYISITDHDELCIIDAEGNKIKSYTIEELSNGKYKNEDELQVDMQGWSDDGLSFWGGVNDLWLPLKLFKINVVDWSITEYDMTQLSIGGTEFMLNPNTGEIVFSDFPITFDVDDLSEFEMSKEEVTLFYYDLVEKKLTRIDSSAAKMFNPEWIDDFTIEYDNPKGQDRIRYKIKD